MLVSHSATCSKCVVVLVVIAFSVTSCLSATSPSNVVLVTGSSTTLRCSADGPLNYVVWSFAATGHSFTDSVNISVWDSTNLRCTESPSHPRYQFNGTNEGQCDLVITNVTASEAGLYQCGGSSQSAASFLYFARVTVLHSEPLCSQNVTANVTVTDVVSMKCVVSYSSDGMNVTMSWYGCPHETLSSSTNVTGNVTYTEHEIYTQAQKQQYLQTCSCDVTTGEPPTPPPGGSVVSPTIGYNWNWTSQADIPVQRCPDSIMMSEATGSRLAVNTVVTCNASGFPLPAFYSLIVLNRGMTMRIDGPSYIFTHEGDFFMLCEATNYIKSGQRGPFLCTNTSTNFTYHVFNEDSSGGNTVSTSLAFLVILLVFSITAT